MDDIRYEDAFACFSEAMSQNDASYNESKRRLKQRQLLNNELPINNTYSLKFDSDFESGNLDLAAQTFGDRNDEYDLVMRQDSNSR